MKEKVERRGKVEKKVEMLIGERKKGKAIKGDECIDRKRKVRDEKGEKKKREEEKRCREREEKEDKR